MCPWRETATGETSFRIVARTTPLPSSTWVPEVKQHQQTDLDPPASLQPSDDVLRFISQLREESERKERQEDGKEGVKLVVRVKERNGGNRPGGVGVCERQR